MLSSSPSPDGLSAIYSSDVKLAQWQRTLAAPVLGYAEALVRQRAQFALRLVVPDTPCRDELLSNLPVCVGVDPESQQAFADDMATLCEMYACLFELEQIGLRLSVLKTAMCPRFHVDRVVCRLICTYQGTGSEWIPAFNDEQDIRRIETGWVALMKGETWPGNEGGGLVHRSPAASAEAPRLIMTLDPVA
jgi:hypothetical protein